MGDRKSDLDNTVTYLMGRPYLTSGEVVELMQAEKELEELDKGEA